MSSKIKKRPASSIKKPSTPTGDLLPAALHAHQQGDFSQAEALYRAVLTAQPRHADALNLLATLYQQQGKFPEAIPLLTRAITIQPSRPDYHSNLGSALRSMGEQAKAAASFRKALTLHPGHLESQFNLAMTLREQGDVNGAIQTLRTLLATKPSFIPAQEMLAHTMLDQRLLAEALVCFQEIVHFAPRHSEAFLQIGNILQAQDKLAAAVAAYEQALAIDPNCAATHNNLGNTLVKQGELHAAMNCYQEALRCDPELGEAHINLSWVYKEHGMIEESVACLRDYLAQHPWDYVARHGLLFTMNYDPTYSPEELSAAAKGWWQHHAPPAVSPAPPFGPPGHKLRIGFLSPDFRQHPVGTFLAPLFAAIDPQAASLHCYAEMTDQQMDDISRHLRAAADTWTCTLGLAANEAAAMIRHDQIDVLIDLAGHSAHNRLDIMALKPAPVQVSWLGYVNTTGLPVIDYRLSDAVADPPGVEAYYSETLYRLPDAFFCYEPPASAPDIGELPAVNNGFVTFGSLNNPAKITKEVVQLWATLLNQVPDARLIMVGAPFADAFIANRYLAQFATHGVDVNRIHMRPTLPLEEYLQLYNQIDIALDPFPHNGHTITCHTLWMGVPVITLAGNRYASRMGASALNAIGLPELIAHSPEAYLDLGRTLARDHNRLASLRHSLRDRFRQSPLCDTARFAQNFLQAMQTIVRTSRTEQKSA